jgi:deoxyribonuclease-4
MIQLGAQMSTAGGLHKAFQRAEEAGCDSMLIFTKSNRQWKAKPLSEKDIEKYKQAAAESSVRPVAVHASYLINIASPKEDLWEKSYQALKTEVERAHSLEIPFLTFHPGSHTGSGEAAGLAQIAKGLRRLLEETAGWETVVCLEVMAGQGTNLGYRFEQLATIIEDVDPDDKTGRLGVCLDTCHLFAAGYDIRSPEAYAETMAEFDRIVGLERVKCLHFNDSVHEFGSRKDRHAHIGEGYIGREGFANFVNDPRWDGFGAHLETPKTEEDDEGNEIEMDPVNLQVLRELIR